MLDVVFLKNGTIIRGTIVEQIPNERLKIQTRDKSLLSIRYSEIDKMAKEPDDDLHKPSVAWLLSFLWTGAGQIYNGQLVKGICMLIGGLVISIPMFWVKSMWNSISSVCGTQEYLLMTFLVLAHTALWVWSQIDAYGTAKKNGINV